MMNNYNKNYDDTNNDDNKYNDYIMNNHKIFMSSIQDYNLKKYDNDNTSKYHNAYVGTYNNDDDNDDYDDIKDYLLTNGHHSRKTRNFVKM